MIAACIATYGRPRLCSDALWCLTRQELGVPHSRGKTATLYGDDPKWRKRLADFLHKEICDAGSD